VPAPGRRLLIAWWSNTGGTARLVQAAAAGAREAVRDEPDPPRVLDVRCDRLAPAAVLAADALLFATPECLGSMAGPMKAFFDRCYYPALDALNGRPYAAIVCAGSDGLGTVRQIERIATGWRLVRAAEPLRVITGAQTAEAILAPKAIGPADLERAATLGGTLAAGLALGLW
jgi:NAD(P)H-dependent FMN reductase